MSDAEKIERLRVWLVSIVKTKSEVHANGARFYLIDSGSLIDTIGGYLNGTPSAGAQSNDDTPKAITDAISAGASVSIGVTGYTAIERGAS